jgi:hypothetical protein
MDTARKILRAEPFTSGKLVWKQDHLLQIHYDVAHIERFTVTYHDLVPNAGVDPDFETTS